MLAVSQEEMSWISEVKQKNPARVLERGLPLDRKQNYLRPLLEALSGLTLAFEAAVAVLT